MPTPSAHRTASAARTPSGHPRSPRAGRAGTLLALSVVVLAIVAYGSTQMLGGFNSDPAPVFETAQVGTQEMLVTVTEDGNVESANNNTIKCEVLGGASILWLIPDGDTVEKGDKIVELASSAIEEQITQQQILYQNARSTLVQAENAHRVAEISVSEYLDGTFKQELQTAETQITIAEENLRTAQNTLAHSQRMFRRGYVSSLELEGQDFAVQRAQLELDSAITTRDVLEKFTKAKMLEDLNSQVKTALAQVNSQRAAFELEEAKLQRLKDQLAKCVIHAPQAGMVVYAQPPQSRRGGTEGPAIEEGAVVRERQDLVKIPDLSKMQVKIQVHESKVEQLRIGTRARVEIGGESYQGTVSEIANQPAPSGSPFGGNVREYDTVVRIEEEAEELRPGLTASVDILLAHLKNALTVPVDAIVEQGGSYYCWVTLPDGGTERRPLVLGLSGDDVVEVRDGLQEGEQVVLRPRSVIEEARQADAVVRQPVKRDVEDVFGEGATDLEANWQRHLQSTAAKQSTTAKQSNEEEEAAEKTTPPASLDERYLKYYQGVVAKYDQDGDSALSPQEWSKADLEADSDGDGNLTAEELTRAAAK